MKIRCLIVDDEPPAVRLISSYIQRTQQLEVAATCSSAAEAFTVLQNKRIDLMFLDIKMPKLLGTDFLRNIPNPPKVIFITAHRDYAVDGFELNVIDFLLKPVSFNRFMKAVSKAIKLLAIDDLSTASLHITDETKGFLYFKTGREMIKIFVHEILFIESCKEYVKIFFDNGSSLLIKQSISSIEKILSPHKFIRVHRSFIVTIEKISSFSTNHVILNTNKIPIGRFYKNELEKILQH